MSFGGLIAGIIGCAVASGVESANQAQIDDHLNLVREDQQAFSPPDVNTFEAQSWIVALEDRINAQGKVLEELYRLIDYQPLRKLDSYLNLKPFTSVTSERPNCCFDQYWRVETGVSRQPGSSSVFFGFVSSSTSVNFADRKGLERIASRFDFIPYCIKKELDIIRIQYWKPNRKRFTKWCRTVLPALGMTKDEIERYISRQSIPVDNPSNDIVYRTSAELEFFDKIVERICWIVEHMISDCINYCLISNGMTPTDRFFNEDLGVYSYSQRRNIIRGEG